MGLELTLDAEPEVHFEQGWTKTDGKELVNVILMSLELIQEHLQLDLSPLKKTAGDEPLPEDLEEIAEMSGKPKEEILHKIQESNKAAWQAPDALADCLNSLIEALANQNKRLPLAELEENHPNQSYFEEGYFLTDLRDLYRWTEQAKKAGAKRVRIFIV